MRTAIVLLAFVLSSAAAADQPVKHWYHVVIDHRNEVFDYFGASALDETAFADEIAKSPFVVLDELVDFDDDGQAKPWSETDPDAEPRVHIRCDRVISFMVLKRDPRLDADGKPKHRDPPPDQNITNPKF